MAKVVLIEQEQALSIWCRLHLESEGHEVTCFDDYGHAFEVIRHHRPDLTLMDIDANESDAFAFAAAVRSNSRTANVPLIFICSADRPERIAQAAAMRPSDLVTKPLGRAALVESVAKRLEVAGHRSRKPEIARVGPPTPLPRPTAAVTPNPPPEPTLSIRVAAVLVVTIRNFVQLAHTLTVDALQELLQKLMVAATAPITARGGWITRVDGNGLTAIFERRTRSEDEHGRAAVEAALEIVLAGRQVKRWSSQLCPGTAMPDISIGCGVHSGEVVTAQLNLQGHLTSTIDGETSQIAYRLDGRSKGLGWSIGATESAVAASKSRFLIGRQASLTDTDRRVIIPIYEILGVSPVTVQAQDLPHIAEIREAVNANSMFAALKADVDVDEMDRTMLLSEGRLGIQNRFPALPGRRPERWLDRSGLGRVLMAHNLATRAQEAIKYVVASESPRGVFERFLDEFEIASPIAQRNVAAVLDIGRTSDIAFAAQEWISGASLAQTIRKKMTVGLAMNYLAQMCMSLDAIHAVGIIHGTLSPNHFCCRTDGIIVLTNFGIVRRIARQLGVPLPGSAPESARYIAPEQLTGSEPGPTADFFSLGVMFLEMLLGEQPTRLASSGAADQNQNIVPLLPVPLSPLQTCLDKLLAADPASRLSCGEDVIAELIAVRNTSLFDFGRK